MKNKCGYCKFFDKSRQMVNGCYLCNFYHFTTSPQNIGCYKIQTSLINENN